VRPDGAEDDRGGGGGGGVGGGNGDEENGGGDVGAHSRLKPPLPEPNRLSIAKKKNKNKKK
jgi:hypothetical protein